MGQLPRMGLSDLKYAPRRTTLRLILDDNVRVELEAAKAASAAVTKDSDLNASGEAARRLEAAEAAADEAAASFVFEAIPRVKLSALIADCPPTSEQLDSWKERVRANPLIRMDAPQWDIDSFMPKLIAASLVEPASTEEEVVELWENGDWSDAIWAALWVAAWDRTNQQVSTHPTSGIGSKQTQGSDPKPATP
jgi:hypothetical protein